MNKCESCGKVRTTKLREPIYKELRKLMLCDTCYKYLYKEELSQRQKRKIKRYHKKNKGTDGIKVSNNKNKSCEENQTQLIIDIIDWGSKKVEDMCR